MAELSPNSFTSYVLTQEEERQGSILTLTQKQVIHNEIAIAAESMLQLELDLAKPEEFALAHADYKGRIAVLQWLLEKSATAEEELIARPPED